MNIAELSLIIGIPAYDGKGSVEPDPEILTLIGGASFTASSQSWTPAQPTPKNGGVWESNPTEEGRQARTIEPGNVVETIPLKIVGTSSSDAMHKMSILRRFILRAQKFATEDSEVAPVQFRVRGLKPDGTPGIDLYALVYTLDLANNDQPVTSGDSTVIDVTLTAEREPGWRIAVPVGAPPTLWSRIARDNPSLSLRLDLSTGALYSQTINNRVEYRDTDLRNIPTIAQNYMTIPASSVPGDMPAFCQLGVNQNKSFTDLYVSLGTKGELFGDRARAYIYNAVNAADKGPSDPAALSVAWGVRNWDAVSISNYLMELSAASETYEVRIKTTVPFTNSFAAIPALWRGRFMVFVRGQYNSLSADVYSVEATFSYVAGERVLQSDIPHRELNSNSQVALTYLGDVQFPFDSRTDVNTDGSGQEYFDADDISAKGITMSFNFTRSATSGTYRLIDLVFVPFDEGIFRVQNSSANENSQSTASDNVVIDDTGYLSRNRAISVTKFFTRSGLTVSTFGNLFMLTPAVENTLYFLADYAGPFPDTDLNRDLNARADYEAWVNIVPRTSVVIAEV